MCHSNEWPPRLLAANVVDDFLIAGPRVEIDFFHRAISERFKVGRFTQDTVLVFNRLHIKQFSIGDIE